MSDQAKADVPPPHYREGEGHNRLITDEQEWLARPDVWGIGALPEPVREQKGALYAYHLNQRLVKSIVCEVCRQPVAEACYDEEPPYDDSAPSALREWYTRTHPADEPKCDAWNVWRVFINYHRRFYTWSELSNRLTDNLYEAADTRPSTSASVEWRKAFRAWSHALALDLIGPNPFRPIPFAPEWRTDTAMSLARGMYESRDFGAMPILADALQDAGCDNADILNHCRAANATHVRGCWVVDLVLGLA